MAEARCCSHCAAELPAGGQFCPQCGAPAGAPVAASVPKGTYWIWVPIAIIGLVLLGWAVLSGMPFSREPRRPATRPMEVVTERESPPTETVEAIGEVEEPAVLPREMTEADAAAALRRYLISSGTVAGECASISLLEYRNRGYTFSVRDRCDERSHGRWRIDSEDPTGQGVFRQHPDGRYLRP